MTEIFVTGTGTDVGKSVVAAALLAGTLRSGKRARYWKPVQTGGVAVDAGLVQTLAPTVAVLETKFTYALPASPDQAAAAEGRAAPTVAALWDAKPRPEPGALTVIEGAGGILVPLNQSAETWVDLLTLSRWPVLVAATPGLGTLNHTVLTVRHLQERGHFVVGVVLSGEPHPSNSDSLGRLLPGVPQHVLPQLPLEAASLEFQAAADALARFVTTQLAARADATTDWLKDDRDCVWHPYTQHKTAADPIAIVAAKGAKLTLAGGEQVYDTASSWWVNTIGHGRPELARALAAQQAELDHVIFAGFTHEPAARLARKLTELAGSDLTRVFYSDNGSTAVEVALKMAFQGFVNAGEHGRTRFLALRGSYHGDTFGAMAVAAADDFHAPFKPLLFETCLIDPVTRHKSAVCPQGARALSERLEQLEQLLTREHRTLAGFIVEPLVQGAAGMLMQPPEFLQGIAQLCQRFRLPLIVDEVFTGLGRVGATFAFLRAGIKPDLVCVAKALTGGTLPLAATLAREDFFAAFLGDDKRQALLHGHSYTANAIACRAALAAIQIFEREDLAGRARAMEERYQTWIDAHAAALGLEAPRALGGILAFELPGSGTGDYHHPRAAFLQQAGLQHGLLLRPLGNTVYFMPPLTITTAELQDALNRLVRVVQTLS